MSAQHTPTPWDVIVSASRLCHVETAHDNPAGAGMPVCSVPVKRAEDAGFIVLACNAHDELVAALQAGYDVLADILHQWPGRDSIGGQKLLCQMRDALANATVRDPREVSSGNRSEIIRAALAKAGAA